MTINPEWGVKKSPFDDAITGAVEFWEWYQCRYRYELASDEQVEMVGQGIAGIVQLNLAEKYRNEPKIVDVITSGARILALDAVEKSNTRVDKYHVAYESAKAALAVDLTDDTYAVLQEEFVNRQEMDTEHFDALIALAGSVVIASRDMY
jgi:hypothetical protein